MELMNKKPRELILNIIELLLSLFIMVVTIFMFQIMSSYPLIFMLIILTLYLCWLWFKFDKIWKLWLYE